MSGALVGLGLLLTFVVDLRVINGMDRAQFELRAPFVLVPLFATNAVWTSHRQLGWRWLAVVFAAASGAAAVLSLAGLLPAGVALVASFGLVALVGLLHAMSAQLGHGGIAARERAAGTALVLGAIAGVAFWSNPPTSLPALGAQLPRWVPALVPLGLLASAGSFVLGVGVARGHGAKSGMAGAALSMASVGYGASLALGIAALLLVRGARTGVGGGLAGIRPAIRRAAVHLVHVAVVLVVIGAGANIAYLAEDRVDTLRPGESVGFAGYTLTFQETSADHRNEAGFYEELHVHLGIRRGGQYLGEAVLTLFWLDRDARHLAYDPLTEVFRMPMEDLYLTPEAFLVAGTGWVLAHGNATRVTNADIRAVSFAVLREPGVTAVWAGLALTTLGGITLLAVGDSAPRARTERPGPQPVRRGRANDAEE